MNQISLKIIVLGDAGVGKTCILRRFADDRFPTLDSYSIGFDFKTCTMQVDNNIVKLELWDTAGEERYQAMRPAYYREAHGILLVYDIASRASFLNLGFWLLQIQQFCPRRVNIVLVANKGDIVKDRQVTQEEGAAFALYCGLLTCEASALNGMNVKIIFATLASDICKRLMPSGSPELPPPDDDDDDDDRRHDENRILLVNNDPPGQETATRRCC